MKPSDRFDQLLFGAGIVLDLGASSACVYRAALDGSLRSDRAGVRLDRYKVKRDLAIGFQVVEATMNEQKKLSAATPAGRSYTREA